MAETCTVCGLPKDLCVCEDIEKEQQKIRVRTETKRFRKVMTIVEGIGDEKKARELGKILKRHLACGGTVKENKIELQGDHKQAVKKALIKEGYKENLIEV